ncbi:hypothetical protein SpAn4DRAFT_2843 [Sporomusa ovata]|uniref:Uncharacterized protein n=1 Tax=Sporomusa ovata TaxID=2378 RepID=A0A0U1KZM0_9FIRM|nr:hypothetical protein SpAn4DRAFT_2843 [Sporomusa ovata]
MPKPKHTMKQQKMASGTSRMPFCCFIGGLNATAPLTGN